MGGLLVPDDWVEETDGFCTVQLTVPNSAYWRANVKGQILRLTDEFVWDAETGDQEQAADIAQSIFDSIQVSDCG